MDNCGLEYTVGTRIAELGASIGLQAVSLNDFTRADMIIRRAGTTVDSWVGIQLKTTRSHVSKKPNCWQFDHVHGYKDLIVMCVVCDDHKTNWMFDGGALDAVCVENVCIVKGGKYDRMAIECGTLLTILNRLAVLIDDSTTTSTIVPTSTEYLFRTDFRSASHAYEFRLFELFDDCVAYPMNWETKWPDGASLTYDKLISFDGLKTWKRAQFKSVSPRGITSGMRGKLVKSVNRKQKAYDYEDADVYVFLFVDDADLHMDVWMLSRDLLVEHGNHISVDGVEGTGYITLHYPESMLGPKDVRPFRDNPTGKGGYVSKSLWTASEHIRVQIE